MLSVTLTVGRDVFLPSKAAAWAWSYSGALLDYNGWSNVRGKGHGVYLVGLGITMPLGYFMLSLSFGN